MKASIRWKFPAAGLVILMFWEKVKMVAAISAAGLALAAAVPVAVSLAADTDQPAAEKPADAAQGKIVAGTPKHVARPGEAWKEKGRIVGKVGQAPAFKVEVLDADGKVALSKDLAAGAKAYELEWLSPGTYTLKVSAGGYGTLEVKDLEVKARNDLVVGLEFDK